MLFRFRFLQRILSPWWDKIVGQFYSCGGRLLLFLPEGHRSTSLSVGDSPDRAGGARAGAAETQSSSEVF